MVLLLWFASASCNSEKATAQVASLDAGPGCETHADCESNVCLPGGVCAIACRDEDECVPGFSCVLLPVERETGRDLESVCRQSVESGALLGHPCQVDAQCHTGFCEAGMCTELCTACASDFACVEGALSRLGLSALRGTCQLDLASPDFVIAKVPVDQGGSAPIAIDVPAGVVSFTVVLEHGPSDLAARVGFISLTAPSGALLLDRNDQVQDLNQGSNPYPGASSLLVPSSDSVSLETGTYALRVGIFTGEVTAPTLAAGEIERVLVFFERKGEEGGLLDVNLFFSPALGVAANSADPWVSELLAAVEGYYRAQATFRLGEVRFGALPAVYDVIQNSDQARQLCAEHSEGGTRGMAVNVFLVGSIEFAAGYSSGTPGPHTVNGTAASGIVVEKMSSAAETGLVVAHELGHYLGLQHTTRLTQTADGYQVLGDDGISDTPTCPPHTNTKECPDYYNLMFPIFPLDNLSLTPGQAAIASRSPMLYEVDLPATCRVASLVVDLSISGSGTGSTAALEDLFEGRCGGHGAPERLHVFHLGTAAEALDIAVHGQGFAPVVYVRRGSCGKEAKELACVTSDQNADTFVTVPAPEAGDYFIAVDGRDQGAGRFTIDVTVR